MKASRDDWARAKRIANRGSIYAFEVEDLLLLREEDRGFSPFLLMPPTGLGLPYNLLPAPGKQRVEVVDA